MARRKPAAESSAVDLFRDVAVETWFYYLMFGRADMDQKLQELGLTRADLRALEYDDEIAAAVETRREAVISTPWHFEPQNGEQPDDKRLLFLYDEIGPHMDRALRCAWSAVPYGYSVGEAVYAPRDGGLIGLESITEKPFEWFIPEVDGRLYYLSKDSGTIQVDTGLKFMVTVRDQTYRQPYGEALFSRLYSAWFFRTHGWRFWIQFLERAGIPFLVGKTAGKTEKMAEDLRRAVQGGTIAIASGDEVNMLSTSLTGDSFQAFDVGVAKRIQKLILGQTLTSDTQGVGSQALGNVHNDVREDRRNGDIRLCKPAPQWLINALWGLNGFPGKPPEFCMEDDTGLQADRAARDLIVYQMGGRFTEQYLYRTFDYEEGDITMEAAKNDAQDAQDQIGTKETAGTETFAHGRGVPFSGRKFTRDQQSIEDLVDAGVASAEQPIDPAIIRRAIQAASGPEDFEDRLSVLLQTDDKALFRRYLESGLFAADVMGYAHAETKP